MIADAGIAAGPPASCPEISGRACLTRRDIPKRQGEFRRPVPEDVRQQGKRKGGKSRVQHGFSFSYRSEFSPGESNQSVVPVSRAAAQQAMAAESDMVNEMGQCPLEVFKPGAGVPGLFRVVGNGFFQQGKVMGGAEVFRRCPEKKQVQVATARMNASTGDFANANVRVGQGARAAVLGTHGETQHVPCNVGPQVT